MSRLQLALNVDDLERAVDFYSTLFAVRPAKVRPGYANFAVAEPPLKLVLIESPGSGGSLNHLGVEVEDTAAVEAAHERLTGRGLSATTEAVSTCCYARQDKFWVGDVPDDVAWEVYTVLADSPVHGTDDSPPSACCTTDATPGADHRATAARC